MRILQVFDLLSSQTNGTIAIISQLSKALSERGHEVVIYTSDFRFNREYTNSAPKVKVHPFRCWLSLANFYITPGIIGDVRRKLKDFDIVHLHCFRSFQNIVVHHYARKYGIPYVLDAHGSLTRTSGGKRGPGWLLKSLFDITFGYRILKGASKVIAETEAGVKEYEKLGISGEKITLIPPSFSLEEFSRLPPEGQFRTRYGIGEKQLIMFLGRIHRIKGLDFLVESFYELTQLRNDVILVIVGPDDGYKSTLDDLIARLNLSDKVLFTGFLSGEEKVSALVDANVVVQTSIYEYGIRAPIEAILCDTPIIVTRHTGAGEIVSKMDAGYLVEYGNTKQLSNMMGYVLDNPSEAKSKIRVAKQYIRVNLSIERGAEKYESVYVDCIAANVNTSRLSRKHNGN